MSDQDLLPSNATKQERALSETIARVSDVPIQSREMWNADTCPASLMPWLAWAFSVDQWESEWSETQKRSVVKNAAYVHRQKGTLGAVRRSLSALGYTLAIVEWFDDSDNLAPFTFTLTIDTEGQPIDPDIYTDARQLLRAAKNVRSHLARLRVTTENTAQIFFGSVSIFGAVAEVYDDGTTPELVTAPIARPLVSGSNPLAAKNTYFGPPLA